MANVLPKLVPPVDAPLAIQPVSVDRRQLGARPTNVAVLALGGFSGDCWRDALCDEVLYAVLEVKPNFILDVAVDRLACRGQPEEAPYASNADIAAHVLPGESPGNGYELLPGASRPPLSGPTGIQEIAEGHTGLRCRAGFLKAGNMKSMKGTKGMKDADSIGMSVWKDDDHDD